MKMMPLGGPASPQASCGCGSTCPETPAGNSLRVIPGYDLNPFVEEFLETPVGRVPRVKTALSRADWKGALMARLGPGRNDYKVSPGLYAVGSPDAGSPVLVTANYKLTFDALRKELSGLSAWILVCDTKGVNVWCSAGKGAFSSEEVAARIAATGLSEVVSHREVLLPQLAAPGVSAREVKRLSGFSVTWGPILSADIPRFLENGRKTEAAMREVPFGLSRRAVLIPVELSHLGRPTLIFFAAAFLLSALGAGFAAAWSRSLLLLSAYAGAVMAGAVAVPLLLPWIPGAAFSVKGLWTGLALGLAAAFHFRAAIGSAEFLAMMLLTTALGSYLAMNFTGATPFTGPSGVEREMRKAIPLQAGAAVLALVLWVAAGFAR